MTTATATAPIRRKKMTVEEYIAFDERAELRHEFDNGKLTEMAGTTSVHNQICLRLALFFMQNLPKNQFKIFMENLKVEIPGAGRYYYPDIMVTGHADDLKSRYIMRHPVLLAEVLSETTRYDDRNRKWLDYQKLPSLLYYLMVDSEKMFVELHARTGKKDWSSSIFTLADESVELPELGVQLPLSEIYDGQ